MFHGSYFEMILLLLIMGFSIYLSFPIIFNRSLTAKSSVLLVSFAAGILVFLMGDIFSDVSSEIYPSGSYIANGWLSLTFFSSVAGIFAFLYFVENRRKSAGKSGTYVPGKVSFIVAIGMGLQNLTEGLVFGADYAVGLTGVFLVILVGFTLQNFTEGFPIVSPYLGRERPKVGLLAGFYFIGGFPTIIGGVIGYSYSSAIFEVLFDGLAIGAVLYVIIPMLRTLFKQAEAGSVQYLLYLGVVLGFLAGFAVNAV
ncbi:metal cation transporter [mine drainage metagenome]|uniref:Metal cation transporter n=1 Tax=mine drainage metagenome TaxID=410659 RepID=T1CJE6_9ZZZZ